MEKLNKRSDGFYETQSGEFAVLMLRGWQDANGKMSFRYRPDFTSPLVQVQWEGDVAFFPEDLAKALISKNYARLPSDKEVAEINKLLG